jgi:hypothetical protein
MSNIDRRLGKIEELLNVGKHHKSTFPKIVVALHRGREMTADERQRLGPVKNWITYQEQLQAGEKANAEYLKDNPDGLPRIIEIELDVDKEYQARTTKSSEGTRQ